MPLFITIHDCPGNRERINAYYRRCACHCQHDRSALADLSRRYKQGLWLRRLWHTLWTARSHNITPFPSSPQRRA